MPLKETQPKGPRQRRTQADRREETRRRTFDAAIACLCREGFAATSASLVSKEAGVTRGAILYHFPSRADLILAVADEAVRRLGLKRRELLMTYPRGIERFRRLTDVSWETQREPEAVALLEILLGARGDTELSDRLPRLIETLEAFQLEGVLELTRDLGWKDEARIAAMMSLHQAALRGLSIDLVLSKDRQRIDAAFELLKSYKDFFIRTYMEDNRQA